MSDGSIGVPVTPLDVGQLPVGCDVMYDGTYQQRVNAIESVHQKTHEGRYFSGGCYEAALANSASLNILVQIGASSTYHARFAASCGGDSTLLIFEGCTFSAAGTAVTVSNHNRSSSKIFDGTVTCAPTLTTDGTQLNGTAFIPGGSRGQASGGEGGFHNEFILKVSTAYLLRITNNSGQNMKCALSFEGYQPTL